MRSHAADDAAPLGHIAVSEHLPHDEQLELLQAAANAQGFFSNSKASTSVGPTLQAVWV
jgi:hypothetical protein